MCLLVNVNSIASFTIAAIVFGLATGVNSPALFAWTADLSHPQRKGIGAGTMFIALEIGIMFGSFVTLFVYSNTLKTASNSFYLGVFTSLCALIYLIVRIQKENKSNKRFR